MMVVCAVSSTELEIKITTAMVNLYFICIPAVHIIFISYSCHGLR